MLVMAYSLLGVSPVIVRFLGTHNAESKNTRLVSFLIDEVLAVEAGSLVSELTFPEQTKIRAILLSHGHYDHIRAIPAFAFNNSRHITRVFAAQQTLEILASHLIDGVVYPEFTSDDSFLGKATLQLVPMEPFKQQNIEGYEIVAIPVKHPLNAVGFQIISGDGKQIFYTGDTGPGLSSVWEAVSPQVMIADVTWPNRLERVAEAAGHMCPEMLQRELTGFRRIKGYLPRVSIIHLGPQYEHEIDKEIKEVAKTLGISVEIAHEGEELIL
jgi:ribonuclease BN (tRNA processing enzyme)